MRFLIMVLLRSLLLLLVSGSMLQASELTSAIKAGVVEVRAYEDGKLSARSLGIVLDDKGNIISSVDLSTADKVSVITQSNAELVANITEVDKDAKIVLLSVSGNVGIKPLVFAKDISRAGRIVYTLDLEFDDPLSLKMSRGTVSQLMDNKEAGKPGYVQHNAVTSMQGFGAPLLNNCKEVIGVNTPKPSHLTSFFEKYDPGKQGVIYSVQLAWLLEYVKKHDITLKLSDVVCLSEDEKARQKIKQEQEKAKQQVEKEKAKAKAAVSAANKKLTEAEKKAAAVAKQAAAAAKKAADAKKAVEAQKKQLEQLKKARQDEQKKRLADIEAAEKKLKELEDRKKKLAEEAEKQRLAAEKERKEKEKAEQEAKEREKNILLISAAAALVLLIIIVLVVMKKRKAVRTAQVQKSAAENAMHEVRSELEQKKQQEEELSQIPDVLIEGITPEGEQIAIKVVGASMGGKEGAVVGRNPSMSDYVINHPEVSRQHFRLLFVSGQLMIEDLGSTNGTMVNGFALQPNSLDPVMSGAEISCGDLKLTIKM